MPAPAPPQQLSCWLPLLLLLLHSQGPWPQLQRSQRLFDVAVDCAQCSAENTLHTVKTTTQSVPRQEQHLRLCVRVCVCECVCAAFAVVVLSCCVFRFPYRVCMPHGPTTVQRTCCGFIERACDLCMKSEKDNEQQQQQLRQQQRLRQRRQLCAGCVGPCPNIMWQQQLRSSWRQRQ